MKVSDYFVENAKEIRALCKLVLPLNKATKELISSYTPETHYIYVSIIQKWREKIIERVFAVRKFRKKTEYQEVIRRIEGNGLIGTRNIYCGQMCGYRVVWGNTKPSLYYFNKQYAFNKWFLEKYSGYNMYLNYTFSLDDLIKLDDSLKYCAYNFSFPLIDYITIYRKHPEIEMLSKLGMTRLIYNQKVLEMLKNKRFKKYLVNCKGNYNTTGKDVLYGFNHNLKLSEIYAERTAIKETASILKSINLPKEKLHKYVKKNNINAPSYIDLINALKYFHLDLTLDKNVFPHDFQYWHDFYTKQMNAEVNKEIDEKMVEAATKYTKLGRNIDGIVLIFPQCTNDLIIEGEKLNHCVGTNNYNKKIAEDKTLILFVRKEDDKETPYVTMEYDHHKKKVLQLYGYHDTQPEQSIKDIIYNKWLPKVKRLKFV